MENDLKKLKEVWENNKKEEYKKLLYEYCGKYHMEAYDLRIMAGIY